MPKYHVTTPQGTFEIDSPTELSDAEVYQHAQSQGAGESAASRGLSGFLSTSPLNPMNLVRAAAHPIDTVTSLVRDPLANLLKAGGDIKDVITGDSGDRTISALNAVKHIGGSVPLIGPAGINAGEKIGEGDVAGGAGELAGLASGALLPKIAANAPAGLIKGGALAERAGAALRKPVSLAGLAETFHSPAIGLPMAAAPYALEYAGKGAQAVGRGLESLRDRATAVEPKPRRVTRPNSEIPYRVQGELPDVTTTEPSPFDEHPINLPDSGPATPTPGETLMQKFYRENPMGDGRLTGRGDMTASPGGLSDLAKLQKYKMPEKVAAPVEPEIPEFEFEGAANDRPGEYPPGPAARGFSMDEAIPEFTSEGASTGIPGDFPVGPAAPGFDIGPMTGYGPEQALLNSPSFRKLTSLNRR
jgi:hypothetical protein